MGKVQQGILDGFVGKVGTVVGSFWKGKPVMRGWKRAIRNPQTNAQQLVRARFAAAGRLTGSMHSAISIGLHNRAVSRHITEGDVFVDINWGHIHADTPGTATIDYAELTIAEGNLPEPQYGNASFADPLSVSVPMTDTTGIIGASADDLVYMFVYDPEAQAGILTKVKREANSISTSVPAYWNGHRVHVYGFAVGAGVDNQGNISNSRYIGSGSIS